MAARVSLDPSFAQSVPDLITEVEKSTSAEVVVAVQAPTSAPTWAGVTYGALGGLTALALCLWAPLWIPEAGVVFIVPLSAVVCGLLGHWVRHRSRPRAVRHLKALNRARAAFVAEGIHRTRARTGVLLLIDEQESRVELVVDTGVEGALAMGKVAEIRFGKGEDHRDLKDLSSVLDGIRALGELLAVALPAAEEDNPDELDNAPRMLS